MTSSHDAVKNDRSDIMENEQISYGNAFTRPQISFKKTIASKITKIPDLAQDVASSIIPVDTLKNIDAPLKTALVDNEDQQPYFNSRMNNGECKGKPLSKETLQRVVNLLDKNVKPVEIAKQLDIHHRTVLKYKKAIKEQNIPSVTIHGQGTKTQGLPVPGKQGGFRWSRMNEEQKQTCIRLAIENPTYSIVKVRESLQELYPELQLSDSTVWRVMRSADLQYMRAKMRDPRKEGTEAHKAELEAFHKEQSKGEDGAFQLEDLFFMDETTMYMNERPSQAWGTKKTPPELDKEKGKTQTIAIYAGLGLVTPQAQKQLLLEGKNFTKIENYTDTRSNHMTKNEFGWTAKTTTPDFCLIWWFRPPQYDKTVVSRFIEEEDILDPHFAVYDYDASNTTHDFIYPAKTDNTSIKINEMTQYLTRDFENYDVHQMRIWLYLNNIEERRVDENGELVATYNKTNNITYEIIELAEMKDYAKKLQNAVAYVLKQNFPDNDFKLKYDPVPPDFEIPRAYYHRWKGRSYKGGTKESVRGDRALFIQYLKNVVETYENVYGKAAKENLRIAWDSASQHGKVDVTANKKSFIHDWVRDVLNIRGAIFLPVRAPDFNPVEFLFAYIKGEVRRKAISGLGKLSPQNTMDLLDEAFLSVTRKMLEGWLSYGCYQGPNLPLTSACRLQVPVDGKKISNFILETWLNILIERYNESRPTTDAFNINRALLMSSDEKEMNKMNRFKTKAEASQNLYMLLYDQPDQNINCRTVLKDSNGKHVYNVKPEYMDIFLLLQACLDPINEEDNGYTSLFWVMTRPVQKEDHDAETSVRIIKRLAKMLAGDSGSLKMLKYLEEKIVKQSFLSFEIAQTEKDGFLSELFRKEASENFLDIELGKEMRREIHDELQKYGFQNSIIHKQFGKEFFTNSEENMSASIRKNIVDLCAIVFELRRLEDERAKHLKQKLTELFEQQVRKGIVWSEVKASMRTYEAAWKREAVPDKYKKTGIMPTGEKVHASVGVASGKAEDIAPIITVDQLRLRYEALRRMEKKKPKEDGARRWPGYPENSPEEEEKETVIGEYLEDVLPVKKFIITYKGTLNENDSSLKDKFLDVVPTNKDPDPLEIEVYYVNGDKFHFNFHEDFNKLICVGKRKPKGTHYRSEIEVTKREDGYFDFTPIVPQNDDHYFKSGDYYYKYANKKNLRDEFNKIIGAYAEENKMLYMKTIQRFNEQLQKNIILKTSEKIKKWVANTVSKKEQMGEWEISLVDKPSTSQSPIIFWEKQSKKFFPPLDQSYEGFLDQVKDQKNKQTYHIRIIKGVNFRENQKIVAYESINNFSISFVEREKCFHMKPQGNNNDVWEIKKFYPHKLATFDPKIRLNKTTVQELLRSEPYEPATKMLTKFKIDVAEGNARKVLVKVKDNVKDNSVVEVFDKASVCRWVRRNVPGINRNTHDINIYGPGGYSYNKDNIPENIGNLCESIKSLSIPDGNKMGCAED